MSINLKYFEMKIFFGMPIMATLRYVEGSLFVQHYCRQSLCRSARSIGCVRYGRSRSSAQTVGYFIRCHRMCIKVVSVVSVRSNTTCSSRTD